MSSDRRAVTCVQCGKQAVSRPTAANQYVTTLLGAYRGFGNTIICRHCCPSEEEATLDDLGVTRP